MDNAFMMTHIQLPVGSKDETAGWYVKNFGARVRSDNVIAFSHGPDVRLVQTERSERAVFDRGNESTQVFGFRTTRIEDLHRNLVAEGVQVSPIVYEGHGNFIYFLDSDGNSYMVHQPPGSATVTDAPLVEGIYYIELPVSDLLRSIEWYTEELGYEQAGMGNPDLAFLDSKHGPNLLLWRTTRGPISVFSGSKGVPFAEVTTVVGVASADTGQAALIRDPDGHLIEIMGVR